MVRHVLSLKTCHLNKHREKLRERRRDDTGRHRETVFHALLTDLDHGEDLDGNIAPSEVSRTVRILVLFELAF